MANPSRIRFSLRKKMILMIVAFALALISASAIIFSARMTTKTDERYRSKANELAATFAATIDVDRFVRVRDKVAAIYNATENKVMSDEWGSDEFNEYTALYSDIEHDPDFIELRVFMRGIQNVNLVKSVYLSFIDPVNKKFVYIADSAVEDPCPPGCIDELYEENQGLLTDPARGFPAYITDTEEYGWLVTAGAPIRDAKGEVVGYAMVDIPMEEVRNEQVAEVWQLIGILLIVMAVLVIVGLFVIHLIIVKPMHILYNAASKYRFDDSDTKTAFNKVMIKTGDEIEALSNSMKMMEEELNERYNKLIAANEEIIETQNVAEQMTELANRDALTGVRNKTAYNQEAKRLQDEIEAGSAEFGIAMIDMNGMKEINDTLGHDAGDNALRKLTSVICGTFSHSPVFRVGGDEFVVITQKYDYRNSDRIVDQFNRAIEELKNDPYLAPGENITAAIGYEVYDKSIDSTVDEVLKRADNAMYAKKRVMKAKM